MSLSIFWLISIATLVAAFNDTQLAGPLNFVYQDFFDCSVKGTTPINITVTPKWLNKTYQVLNGDLDTPIPIGNNIMVKISIYTQVREKWLHLTNVSGRTCHMMRNYMGPLRETLLLAAGLPPGTCPIPKGTYHSRNFNLDMKNSRVPAFPYGTFKLLLSLHDIFTDVVQMCLGMHLQNKPI